MSYTSKEDVLKRIEGLSHQADFPVAVELLKTPDIELSDVRDVGMKHAEERFFYPQDVIIRVWDAKLQNSIRRGFKLYGCADFVKTLKELPADTRIFELLFKNAKVSGKFYFVQKTWQPVGFVIVREDELPRNMVMSHTSKEDALKRIEGLSHLADFSVAVELLKAPDTEFSDVNNVMISPAEERILYPRDIIRAWDLRLNNSIRNGFKLYGCADFVNSLKELPADTRMFNLTFKNPRFLGKFYFVKETWQPVGFGIVRRDEVSKADPQPYMSKPKPMQP